MRTPPWQPLLIQSQFLKPWTAQARDECSPAYAWNITLHIHNLALCRGSSNLISLPSEENVSALLLCSIFFLLSALPTPPLPTLCLQAARSTWLCCTAFAGQLRDTQESLWEAEGVVVRSGSLLLCDLALGSKQLWACVFRT